jgi:hypothetical protein
MSSGFLTNKTFARAIRQSIAVMAQSIASPIHMISLRVFAPAAKHFRLRIHGSSIDGFLFVTT